MKKHILSSVGKKAKMLLSKNTFYDFKKQMSFIDNAKTIPVIIIAKENTIVETSTIETSDPDEFAILNEKTYITESIENSDADEFHINFSGTIETRTIEDSDIDTISSLASQITKTLENSDADEFLNFPPRTTQTFTIENSDSDEFALG